MHLFSAANLFRALPRPPPFPREEMCLKNTSGARTSILRLSPPNICHVITTCSVHSPQTKVSLSAKQRPSARNTPRFRLFLDAYCTCAKKDPRALSLQASLQKLSPLGGSKRGRAAAENCCIVIVPSRDKPTLILHLQCHFRTSDHPCGRKRYVTKSD